jgi:NitT/TauT family transport system permease protein
VIARSAGRETARPATLWADVLAIALVIGAVGGLASFAREWTAPLTPEPIDLSLSALPRYTLFSLSRGLVAYGLSVVFAVVYGTAAARSPRAERVMVPLLDVLQSIPVLSFLPGFVVALVALFPSSRVGLETACVLAIFTGQVWNMTFSYHASLRSIPSELAEVTRVHRFTKRQRFLRLEMPAAMIGLVWNSMMSMAGGWFFLTIIESFRLGERDYRLPGLGSYMAAATEAGRAGAVVAAIAAMAVMIVLLDQLLWRPLIAWSERFKADDTATAAKPKSWFYDFLRRSRLRTRLRERMRSGETERDLAPRAPPPAEPGRRSLLGWTVVVVASVLVLVGAVQVIGMLAALPARDWLALGGSLGATALRVAAAVLLGALWTLPLGIVIGRSARVMHVAQPLIQLAASFPVPMLFPIVAPALLRAGTPQEAISIGLMMLGTQWYVLFNVVAGAAAVPHDLREVGAAYRMGRLRTFLVVDLAGVFPALVTGIVTAAGGAWNASIVAESVTYRGGSFDVPGIGSTIAHSFEEKGAAGRLAAATVVLAATLIVVNRLVWRPLYRLAERRFALNR